MLTFLRILSFALVVLLSSPRIQAEENQKPRNIVLIYADDIGYGDLSCYGAEQVKTPHLDSLAKHGLRFTDAHAPSATCTPSRYAMLTGEYAWRREGTGIARGDAAAIIQPGRMTLASLMKEAGYRTGVVGKWHLGLGAGNLDWNGKIAPGPLEIGFDYSFLIPATGDRVPCVYVENHRVVNLDPQDPIRVSFRAPVGSDPTGKSHPQLLKMHPSHGHNQTIVNGISRIGYMSGGNSARWVDEDMADEITKKAVQFIDRNRNQPFFLFFSTHDIHVPRVPHPRFVGKTSMGPRGDAIVQLDWCVGQILGALKQHQLTDETLVIFTSDNGPVIDDGYHDEAVKKLGKHRASGPWRGGKYSKFEGGTRVPCLVQWPARIQPGQSSALICQIDFPMSLSQLTNPQRSFQPREVPDSLNVLPALLGASKTGRDHLVEHGRGLALRLGPWKLIEGGPGPRINRNTNTELGNAGRTQLYHLGRDPGERKNLAQKEPQQVELMLKKLNAIRAAGRSR